MAELFLRAKRYTQVKVTTNTSNSFISTILSMEIRGKAGSNGLNKERKKHQSSALLFGKGRRKNVHRFKQHVKSV